jgi:glycosyltransferase involved in cell wall biosynthesis
MPRILRIINRLNLGGPTYNVAYLTRYLQPEYETLLVSGQIDETEASSGHILDQLGIQPRYVEHMYRELSFWKDRKGYQEIRKIIQEFKPDIVHTHAAKAGALGRLAAAHEKVPVILHTFHGHVFHSYFSPLKTRLFIEIERYLARKSSAIVAISATQKQELAEEFRIAPSDKIHIVHNGFDLNRFQTNQDALRQQFRKAYHVQESEVAVGIIGRLVPVKNHELFLRALAGIQGRTSVPVRAFIIGDGEDRAKVESLCRELQLPTLIGTEQPTSHTPGEITITFTSWITDIERPLAGLDIVALTSLNEGTPVSLIEAEAAARAIISTRVGGVADIVPEGKAGILVPSQDTAATSAAFLRLIEHPEERQRMGIYGREFVADRFTYQALCANMSRLYHQLLGNAQSKRG